MLAGSLLGVVGTGGCEGPLSPGDVWEDGCCMEGPMLTDRLCGLR